MSNEPDYVKGNDLRKRVFFFFAQMTEENIDFFFSSPALGPAPYDFAPEQDERLVFQEVRDENAR